MFCDGLEKKASGRSNIIFSLPDVPTLRNIPRSQKEVLLSLNLNVLVTPSKLACEAVRFLLQVPSQNTYLVSFCFRPAGLAYMVEGVRHSVYIRAEGVT